MYANVTGIDVNGVITDKQCLTPFTETYHIVIGCFSSSFFYLNMFLMQEIFL